jgi:hypothetical protein
MTTTDPEHLTTGGPAAGAAPESPHLPTPVARMFWWRDVAVGAAVEAEQVTAGMVAGLRAASARRRRWVGELAERGAAERIRSRRAANAAAASAVNAVATSALVEQFVDAQLERVLRPVVLTVLDEVLLLLEKEPERIQGLIRGQRDSMVDELVDRIRMGAVTGDTAVERLTSRVLHRGPRPAPAPPVDGP